ncbi:hypothetical protein V8F33_004974 [Rhypophila sp. PSN 637]
MAAVHAHEPIDAFKKSISDLGTFSTSIMQGNMLAIEITPDPSKSAVVDITAGPSKYPSRPANLLHIRFPNEIRAKLDAIPGIKPFKPIVKTNKQYMTDEKGKQKEICTYSVYLDLNLWTAEDEARGYRKSDVLIRPSVNKKQDEKLLRRMKSTTFMKPGEEGRILQKSATQKADEGMVKRSTTYKEDAIKVKSEPEDNL